MKIENLRDLFEDCIKDIYSAESQLVKALPKMAKATTNPELKLSFEKHLEQTKVQQERLVQICERLGISKSGKTCKAMEGLIEEASEVLKENIAEPVLDAALISCAQKVEHYEIATYGTLCVFAEHLGEKEIKKILGMSLAEEKETDQLLTKLAESWVNEAAN